MGAEGPFAADPNPTSMPLPCPWSPDVVRVGGAADDFDIGTRGGLSDDGGDAGSGCGGRGIGNLFSGATCEGKSEEESKEG
jgi:hypothetical protein